MNYDLCKQLKDAGFPQAGTGDFFRPEDSVDGTFENCYIPTLAELIAACGEKFGSLEKAGEQFIALEPKGRQTILVAIFQSTPEEAVAKLWLALQK